MKQQIHRPEKEGKICGCWSDVVLTHHQSQTSDEAGVRGKCRGANIVIAAMGPYAIRLSTKNSGTE
jgi:hypothetical protein